MQKLSLDANEILDRLAEARDIPPGRGRDAALARELEISSKRIFAWRDRKTLDHDIIAFKCREWRISLSWAFFGDGPREIQPAPPEHDAMSAMLVLHAQMTRQIAALQKQSRIETESGEDGDGKKHGRKGSARKSS